MLITTRVSKVFHRLVSVISPPRDARPRVLIHGMNYAPEFIGVGKYTTELALYLAARQYRVEVLAALPHYPGWTIRAPYGWRYHRDWEGGVMTTRCPLLLRRNGHGLWRLLAPLSFALAAAPLVFWRAIRTRPDVVLCVEPTLFAAPAALLAGALVGARTVLHVQDLEIDAAFATKQLRDPRVRQIAQCCERFLLRRFDAIFTICDSMANRLRARGVEHDRLRVLRNWVDLAALEPTLPPGALRTVFGLPEGKYIVLYAGHLGAKQGLSVLIEAARALRCDPRVHIVVAGDGPMAATMRAAAASLKNMTVVGLQPPALMGDLLALADAHVLPQDAAAGDLVFPSKLGALLATGKPIVVTANAGTELAQWLDGAATVIPAGDGRALAKAIRGEVGVVDPLRAERAKALAAELANSSVLPAFEAALLPPTPSHVSDPAGQHSLLPEGWGLDPDRLGLVQPG